MIKAVLFDLNGIIIDDEHIHELAFRETVAAYGINLTHEDYLECCAGKTDKAGYESMATKFSVELPVLDLLDAKSKMYLQLFPSHKKTYPGVLECIYQLSKTYRLALTSSASRAEVELVTQEYKIADLFEVRVTAEDIVRGKPDPEPYVKTARLMNLLPEFCVAIEDSKSGITSAKSAGCYCIAVTTTRSADALSAADKVVTSFDEITEALLATL